MTQYRDAPHSKADEHDEQAADGEEHAFKLRDIAAEAGTSHPKLLNYFDSKDTLILSYVKYTREYMSKHCMEWFRAHSRKDYG